MRCNIVTISISLFLATLLGCTPLGGAPQPSSSTLPTGPGTASSFNGQFALAWKQEVGSRAMGVAVAPSGEVYLGVTPSKIPSDPFAEGGGVMVFSPKGEKLKDIPTLLPKVCDSCDRTVFTPKGLRVAGDSIWIGNYIWALFQIDPAGTPTQLAVDTNDISTSITGIDFACAFTPDGARAYLVGRRLYVLNLQTGLLERSIGFGQDVQQVVPASGSQYLVNITDDPKVGKMALWDPTTNEKTTFDVAHPVRGIACDGTWAVGALETGTGEYQVVQWDLTQSPPVEKALAGFTLSGGNSLRMAVRPGKRQVAIGTTGIQAVNDSHYTFLSGNTVIVDADKGTFGRADTGNVQDLAFSPDGGKLYVADQGGLKAFALP